MSTRSRPSHRQELVLGRSAVAVDDHEHAVVLELCGALRLEGTRHEARALAEALLSALRTS